MSEKTVSSEGTQFYKDTVWDLFDKKSSARFSNGAPEHARIIYQAMFHFAEKQVNIFCEKLDPNVFSGKDLEDELVNALKRKIKVKIFTQNNVEKSNFAQIIRGNMSKETFVKHVPRLQSEKVNFAVMDESAFRYEPDKKEVRAFASANEPETCKSLLNLFSQIEALAH